MVGMLLAPKPGKQMRRDLRRSYETARETFDDWKENAKDFADDVMERGSDIADDFRERVTPVVKAVKRRWRTFASPSRKFCERNRRSGRKIPCARAAEREATPRVAEADLLAGQTMEAPRLAQAAAGVHHRRRKPAFLQVL